MANFHSTGWVAGETVTARAVSGTPPYGATGSAVDSQTAGSDGSVDFTGLAEETAYIATGGTSGRTGRFRVPSPAATTGGGSGLPSNVVEVTANYTAVDGDLVEGNSSGGAFTVTLPTSGTVLVLKADGSDNAISVDAGGGGGQINGSSDAVTLTALGDSLLFKSTDDDQWYAVPSSAQSGSSVAPGNPNFMGFQPVGDHTNLNTLGPLSDASNSGTYLVRHMLSAWPVKSIILVYSNTGISEADGANDITIKAAVRTQDGSTIPVEFYGQPTITIKPGRTVYGIAAGVSCGPDNTYIQSATYVSVASGSWPGNVQGFRQYPKEGFAAGVDHAWDGNSGGSFDFNSQILFGPALVLGSVDEVRPIFGFNGDSITHGTGDSTQLGQFERAMTGIRAYALTGYGGTTAGSMGYAGAAHTRMSILAGCTHVLNSYGTNDIGASAATIAGRLVINWKLLQNNGSVVYQSTLLPRTTSSDSWATTANQTTMAGEDVRVAINDWIRGGGKVDGSGVPVFDGSGTASTYLDGGCVELADAFETARNSGKWKSVGSGVASAYTADGIHPSTAGHTAGAVVVSAWAAAIEAAF